MGWHPIHDHTDASLVERVYEKLKIIGRAVAAARREETGHLVTPGGIESMLGHGHEFDMGEAHLFDVIDEGFGEFAIAEGFCFRLLSPGAEMNFVNAERRAEGIGFLSLCQPSCVGP